MGDSGEELVGDFEEIDAVINETGNKSKITGQVNRGNAVLKRKSSETTSSSPSKAKRIESVRKSASFSRDNDRNLFSAVQDQEKVLNEEQVINNNCEVANESSSFLDEVPEDELLALDSRFSEDMFDRISTKFKPKGFGGYCTKVRVTPVVILDMADPAMQELIKFHQTNICFFFKGQAGKFRKKKGYAEIYVEKDKDWYTALHHLCKVNFDEERIKIQVSIIKVSDNKLHAQGSYVIRRSRPEKIQKLCEDIKVDDTRPANKEFFLTIPEIPDDISLPHLRYFLPFLPTLVTDKCEPIKSKPGFKGPIRMCYKDSAQVKSVSDIFADYTVNNQSLSIIRCSNNDMTTGNETKKSSGKVPAVNTKAEEKKRQVSVRRIRVSP